MLEQLRMMVMWEYNSEKMDIHNIDIAMEPLPFDIRQLAIHLTGACSGHTKVSIHISLSPVFGQQCSRGEGIHPVFKSRSMGGRSVYGSFGNTSHN